MLLHGGNIAAWGKRCSLGPNNSDLRIDIHLGSEIPESAVRLYSQASMSLQLFRQLQETCACIWKQHSPVTTVPSLYGIYTAALDAYHRPVVPCAQTLNKSTKIS